MADYHSERDRRSLPFYELTAQLAALEPLPHELEQLLAACRATRRRWTSSPGSAVRSSPRRTSSPTKTSEDVRHRRVRHAAGSPV